MLHSEPSVWRISGGAEVEKRSNGATLEDSEADLWGDDTVPAWEKFPLVDANQLAAPIKPARWLVKGVWIERSSGVVAGKKKAFKTWQMHSMAAAVATGRPFLNKFHVVSPGPVIYLTGEGGQDEFQSRHQAIARRYGVSPSDMGDIPFLAMFKVAPLDDAEFISALRYHLDSVQPVAVYMDPLYAYHPTDVDVSSVYSRGQMLAAIREEVEPYAALIVGDHINKSASNSSLELDDIGFSGVSQWVDSWSIQRHREKFHSDGPNNYARLEVLFGSRRTGSMFYNVDWHLTRDTSDPNVIKWAACDWTVVPSVDGQVVHRRNAEADVAQAMKAIVQTILAGMDRGDGPEYYTMSDIQETVEAETGLPRRRVKEAWKKLTDARKLEKFSTQRVGKDGKRRGVDVWTVSS
ncbi:hypothetical protein BST23_25320 [Mycolicibacterium elephantis]|uniref:Uncharacterized protein n=1 Tax=Mycolicibacterium elephantis TaxID=81858 RepID=A0A1X0CFL6_9MYCO|nr:AAA family ATPase [Mycolicibacterium elephantis]ORA58702.1 hypothetical protein BST23_25320 [Mycolicibacterium elephantis]